MATSLSRNRFVMVVVVLIALIAGVLLFRSSSVSAGTSFNEGLETLDVSGQIPTGWWRAGYGTSTASWYFDPSPHAGVIAQGVRVSNWRSGDRKLLTSQTGSGLPVISGRTYNLSSWYRTDGTTEFVIYRRTTSGSWSYWTSSGQLTKSGTWRNAKFTTPPIPSGTVGISFGVALRSNGTLVTDDYGLADTVVLPSTTAQLEQLWCSSNSALTVDWYPNADHFSVPAASAPTAMTWIAQRFAGQSATNTCNQTPPVAPAVNPPPA